MSPTTCIPPGGARRPLAANSGPEVIKLCNGHCPKLDLNSLPHPHQQHEGQGLSHEAPLSTWEGSLSATDAGASRSGPCAAGWGRGTSLYNIFPPLTPFPVCTAATDTGGCGAVGVALSYRHLRGGKEWGPGHREHH